MIGLPSTPEAAGAAAFHADRLRLYPVAAPSSPPGSPESSAWAADARAWLAGWDAANLAHEGD